MCFHDNIIVTYILFTIPSTYENLIGRDIGRGQIPLPPRPTPEDQKNPSLHKVKTFEILVEILLNVIYFL